MSSEQQILKIFEYARLKLMRFALIRPERQQQRPLLAVEHQRFTKLWGNVRVDADGNETAYGRLPVGSGLDSSRDKSPTRDGPLADWRNGDGNQTGWSGRCGTAVSHGLGKNRTTPIEPWTGRPDGETTTGPITAGVADDRTDHHRRDADSGDDRHSHHRSLSAFTRTTVPVAVHDERQEPVPPVHKVPPASRPPRSGYEAARGMAARPPTARYRTRQNTPAAGPVLRRRPLHMVPRRMDRPLPQRPQTSGRGNNCGHTPAAVAQVGYANRNTHRFKPNRHGLPERF